jgi:hypothetical protein
MLDFNGGCISIGSACDFPICPAGFRYSKMPRNVVSFSLGCIAYVTGKTHIENLQAKGACVLD